MALQLPRSSIPLPASKLKAFESLYGLKSFHLPKLSFTLPLKWHPDFLSLSRQADEWICTHLQITDDDPRKKELREERGPLFSSMTIPFGDYEKALACCKYVWTLFVLDDPLDDDQEGRPRPNEAEALAYLQSIMSIARGTMTKDECAGNPVLAAFGDVTSDLRRLMPGPAYDRFVAANQAWIDSIFSMSELSVPAYMQYRRANGAADAFFPLLEWCLGINLEAKDVDCPDLLSAQAAVSDSICLVNDLHSTGKDHHFRRLNNIQFALLSTDPAVHNFQEAVDETCSMIQQKEEEFIFYHDIVASKAKESGKGDLMKYMEALRYMIPGNIVYHNLSGRFHGIIDGDILHGTWDLTSKLSMIDMKPASRGSGKYSELLAL